MNKKMYITPNVEVVKLRDDLMVIVDSNKSRGRATAKENVSFDNIIDDNADATRTYYNVWEE